MTKEEQWLLITELTWLLVNISTLNCNEVCKILVTSQDEIITASSNIIEIANFDTFFKVKKNREVIDNLLWFYCNLLAEELENSETDGQSDLILSERISSKILNDTCFLEVIRLIIAGCKINSKEVNLIKTIIWGMKNTCLHANFVLKCPLNIQQSFLIIIRQILFECYTMDTINSEILIQCINVIIDMLNISLKADINEF